MIDTSSDNIETSKIAAWVSDINFYYFFLVKTIGKTVVWSTYDPFEVVEIFKINFLIERTFWLLHSPLNKHSHLLAELTVCQIATFYIKIAPRRKKLTYV